MGEFRIYDDTKKLAARTGFKEQTWRKWRWNGLGPPYQKVNSRVLYDREVVDQWLAEHEVRSTSELPPRAARPQFSSTSAETVAESRP
jgi:hypothetical protein